MTEFDLLDKIKTSYQTILKERLAGIYVHGSLAFHCFHWDQSDIDFLVVVNCGAMDRYCCVKPLKAEKGSLQDFAKYMSQQIFH